MYVNCDADGGEKPVKIWKYDMYLFGSRARCATNITDNATNLYAQN